MIDANGNYICDYCQNGGSGEYFSNTGNHVLCQKSVITIERIAELEAKLVFNTQGMAARIAQLEAQLAEAEKAIRGIMAVAYPYGNTPTKADAIAYQRCAEFLKREAE